MDTRLSGYGWSGSADCSISETNDVVFNTEGVLYSANTFKTNKKKVRAKANFKYANLDIGLVLWYNNESGYMRFAVNQNILFVERMIRDIPTIISQIPFGTLTPPATGSTVALEAELSGTNLKCYYNGTEVFNIEQSLFKQGYFGVYGSAGETCTDFSLQSSKIGEWSRNIPNSTSIDKDGDFIRIIHNNPLNPFAYISQNVSTPDGSYSVSFDYTGDAHLTIMNGVTLLHEVDFEHSDVGKRASFSFTASSTPTVTVMVGSKVVGTHLISIPQIENKQFDTAYTNEVRGNSVVTFPAQNMNKEFGGMAMYIKPIYSYPTGTLPIFYYNDSINLVYTNNQFLFKYGSQTVVVNKAIEEGKWYYVACIWENTNSIYTYVGDGTTEVSNSLSISTEIISSTQTLHVGCTPVLTGNLVIDNLVVYKNYVTIEKLLAHKDNEELYDENVVIKSNFNKNTFVYDKNRVALPVGKPNTPMVVETESGVSYSRVYFVDSGRYVTYNIEIYEYKDTKTFKVAYDNILKAEVFTYEMDKMFADITIDGDRITVNDLTDEYIGETIVFKYTVKDTYSLNYNSEFNQYEIEFSNTDGEPINVYYDNAEGTDKKLVKAVELNPFKSTNNSGFIYIEDTPRTLETFDIKITPDSLVADGFDTATITVDCLSKNGVPTSNVQLVINEIEVSDESSEIPSVNGYGTIKKYVTEEEAEWKAYATQYGESKAIEDLGYLITDEHRAGRFIYKYKAGKFTEGQYEMTDNVIIRDKISGIGIQIPIRLVRES
jgi:hypothetical protein